MNAELYQISPFLKLSPCGYNDSALSIFLPISQSIFLTTFCLLFILHFPFCDQCCQGVYPWFAFQVFAHHYYSFCIISTDLLKYKHFQFSIKLLFKLSQNEDYIFFLFFFFFFAKNYSLFV